MKTLVNNTLVRMCAMLVLGFIMCCGFVAMVSTDVNGDASLANIIGLPIFLGSGYLLTRFKEIKDYCKE